MYRVVQRARRPSAPDRRRGRLRRRLLIAAAVIAGVAGPAWGPSARAADVTSTWFGGTGNWSAPGNWISTPPPNRFPNNGNGGFTYDAIVNAGRVELDTTITVEKFALGNATLNTGDFNGLFLTVRDTFTWNGGTITGIGFVQTLGGVSVGTGATGVLNLSGSSLSIAAGQSATLRGTVNVTNGARLSNAGALTVPTAASIGSDAAGGVFFNAGSFTTSTAGGVSVGIPFNNSGSVSVPASPAGLSLAAGGTHAGAFGVAAGGTLSFSGNHTFQQNSSVTGGGIVAFSAAPGGGTVNISGAYNVSGSTVLTGATVSFNAQATTGTLLVSSGTLNGGRGLAATNVTNQGGTILTGSGTIRAVRVDLQGGTTTVGGGRIVADTLTVSGGSNSSLAGGQIVLGGGPALRTAGASAVVAGAVAAGAEPEVLTFTGALSPTVSLAAHATVPGTIVLGGDVACNVPSGTARVTSVGLPPIAGTIDLNADLRTFTVANGTAALDMEVSARLTNGGLRKGGGGTLRLTAANDHAAGTTVAGGTLEAAHPNALGTGAVTFSGGRLNLRATAADTTFPNPLTAAPADGMVLDVAREGGGAATVRVPSANLGAALDVSGAAASTLAVSGPVTLNAAATVNNSANVAFNGAVGGAFGFTKTLGGTLTLAGAAANTYAGATVVNEGELVLSKSAGVVAVPGSLRINGPGSVRLTAANQIANGAAVTVNGAVQNATWDLNGRAETVASLDNSGTVLTGGGGALTVGPVTGSGSLNVGAGGLLSADYVRQGTLTLAGTAAVDSRASGGAASAVKALVIAGAANAWTGRLDLNDTALIVDYTGAASPLATVSNQIRYGRDFGNGITSTSATAARGAGLGYAEASVVLGPSGGTFRGQPADGTAVLVRYTLLGDATLDGFVDSADFARLAGNFGRAGQFWSGGDFNYDSTVDASDFALLAGNFGRRVSGGAGLAVTAGDWEAVEAFGASAGVPVPEPGAAGLLALAAVGLLRRRAVPLPTR